MVTSRIKPRHINTNKLRLDWKAYFLQFIEEHGEPIQYNGSLLFRDGWQYSSTDYAGPEYEPPDNPKELKALQLIYWSFLHGKLSKEIGTLAKQIAMLKDWQSKMSLPLKQRISYVDRDQKGSLIRKLGKPENLRLTGLESNLKDLQAFRDEAQEHLDNLS